jgi:predicted deacylase
MDSRPTRHSTSERRLGQLPSGETVAVHVHRYAGGEGPTVYVQAAQHGIELNGPAACRRLHDHLVDADLAGTVVVVPVANPLAFDHRRYLTPGALDAVNPNQNRVWPGDAGGTLGERLVARLWPLVEAADAVVDLHTGTASMLTHTRVVDDDTGARALASAFGTEHLVVDELREPTDEEDEQGTLRAAVSKTGRPAVTVELGDSRTVSRDAAAVGRDGVVNVLRTLGLLDADAPADPDPTVLWNHGDDVRTDSSGVVEFRADLAVGDRVTEGERLGVVYDPARFVTRETLTAPAEGVVYSLGREAVAVAGERVAALARPTADE